MQGDHFKGKHSVELSLNVVRNILLPSLKPVQDNIFDK